MDKEVQEAYNRSMDLCNESKFGIALKEIDSAIGSNKDVNNRKKLIELKAKIFSELNQLQEAIQLLEKENDPSYSTMIENYKKQYEWENSINPNHPDYKLYESFENWIKEYKGRYSKLKLVYYSKDYRGVHATSTIKKDEVFLRIPEALIINYKKAKETPLGKKLLISDLECKEDFLIYLTIFILEARSDKNSFWAPYLKIIPESVSNFPLFYVKEELDMLKGSSILGFIEEATQEYTEQYNLICKEIPEIKKYSLEDYIKISVLIVSRVFCVKINQIEEKIVVPYADMFNHHYDRIGQSHWEYNEESKEFIVTAQKDIPRGDFICENYGIRPNVRFLFYYGFLIEQNRLNALYIDLSLDENDPLVELKKTMLGITGLKIQKHTYYSFFNQGENNQFFSCVRFIVFRGNPENILKYLSPRPDDITSIDFAKRRIRMPQYSIENEIKMHEKIITIANKHLSLYETTIEEDEKLLKTELTMNKKNIIYLRKCEKQLYNMMKELSTLSISLLHSTIENLEKHMEKIKDKQYAPYVDEVLVELLKYQH